MLLTLIILTAAMVGLILGMVVRAIIDWRQDVQEMRQAIENAQRGLREQNRLEEYWKSRQSGR